MQYADTAQAAVFTARLSQVMVDVGVSRDA